MITPYARILYTLIEKSCEKGYIVPGKGWLCSYDRIRKVLRYAAALSHEVFYYEKAEDFNFDLDAYTPWDQYRVSDQRGVILTFAPNIEHQAQRFDDDFKQSRNTSRKEDMLRYFRYPLKHRSWMFEQTIMYEKVNRVYPLKNVLDEHKCIALVTAPGLGKTQAIVEYIKGLPDNVPVVVVSFRVALSEKQSADFDGMGFTHYSRTAREVMLRLHELKRLIIQVDSLLRMSVKVKDFVLVLDEWESLNDHLCCSPYINNQREIANLLVNLIASSKSVIIADANYSYGSHDFFTYSCNLDPVIYYNDYIRNPRQASFFAGKGQLIYYIIFLLRNGKKVYVPTNSKRFGKRLLRKILEDPVLMEQNNPNLVKLYCNETPIGTNKDPIHDMINYQCCIVTPKFQAGNSFVEDHFDEVCGHFTAASSSPEAAAQLLMRVRNIKNTHNHFHIDNRLGARKRVLHDVHNMHDMMSHLVDKDWFFNGDNVYLSSKKAMSTIRLNYGTETISLKDPMNFLALVCATNLNEGHKNYAHRFISILHSMGYTFHNYYDDENPIIKALNTATEQEMKLMDQEERKEYLEDLAQVSVPKDNELEELLDKQVERRINREEKLQLTKLRLLSKFALTEPDDPKVLSQALELEHPKRLMRQTILTACSLDTETERKYIQRMANDLAGCPEERPAPSYLHFYELEYPNRALVILTLLSFLRALGFHDFFDPREVALNKDDLISYVSWFKGPNRLNEKDNIQILFERPITDKELTDRCILKWLNRKLQLLKISVSFRNNRKQKNKIGYLESPWRLAVVKNRVDIICPQIEGSVDDAVYAKEYPNLVARLTKEKAKDIHELTASLTELLSDKLSNG